MRSTENAVVVERRVPIALLYQAVALHEHLKRALTELGAQVVYETETSKFDRESLASSGARVVVINLDPQVEEDIAQLDDLLVDDELMVVFNDGEVSSRLEGWDAARWARHLATKILGNEDTNPPRPPGAEAIPVKVKQSAPDYIGAPSIDQSFELAGHELANALAADTGEAIARTRAALVTALEPIAPELVGGERPATPGMAAAGPDFAAEPHADAGDATSADFLELDLELEAPAGEPTVLPPDQRPTLELPQPVPPAAAEPPTLELPRPAFAATELPPTMELPQPDFAKGDLPPTVELPQPEFARVAPAPAPPEPATDAGIDDITAEFERSLQAFGIAVAAADSAPAPATEDELSLGDLDLELSRAFDAAGASEPKLGDDAPQGLDDLLLGLSLEPTDEDAAAAPAPAAKAPAAAAGTSAASAGKPAPATRPAATDKTAAEPAAAEPPARSVSSFDLSHLSLAPLDGEEPSAPVTGRARFNIDEADRKARAAAAPPPPAPAPAPAPAAEAESFEALEFTLDTVDPLAREIVPQDAERLEAELMAEIEALSAQAERGPAAQAGPIERVWVLGASIGGPDAVREFLGALQSPLPVVFLLAQHMGADFYELMVQQLGRATTLRVRAVGEGETVAHGDVVVVPLDRRLLLDASGVAHLAPLEEQSPYSPSIDLVMRDVADRFGANAGAIVFSGMAHDAIDGSSYLASKGGTVWAQDPNTCVISSMVDGAIDAGVVSFTGAPMDLARRFNQQFGAG